MRCRGFSRRGVAIAALLAVAYVTAPAAGQDTVRVVTLEEALRLARSADPALVAAHGAETTARATLMQRNAEWLPTLSLNSSYANSSNQRFDQSTGQLVSESYTAQLSAGYELFTGGRRLLTRRSASAEVGAAQARARAQRFGTDLETQSAFYAAAAGAELLAVAGQRLERARQQLEFAETRLEVGTATRSDVLRAELEVGNAELGVLDAESALRANRLALGRRLGLEEQVQPAAGALPEDAPPLPPIEVLAERAERSSPDAVAARASLAARRADARASYTSYLPTIRATGGYDWFAYDFPPEERSWSLRVIASFPIFNGLQRETAVARARAAERTARVVAHDAAIGARIAAENATREIEAAARRVEIAERAVQLAREDLRVQEERYQLGNVTILDLQASQVALADAEIQWVTARQGLAAAVARLESVLGESLPAVELTHDTTVQ